MITLAGMAARSSFCCLAARSDMLAPGGSKGPSGGVQGRRRRPQSRPLRGTVAAAAADLRRGLLACPRGFTSRFLEPRCAKELPLEGESGEDSEQ